MDSPELTVVVPSVNGLGDLVGCLEAVDRLRQSVRLEILVVDRLGGEVAETVQRRFPHVVLLGVPAETTIPQMRDLAFRRARGDAVAVIEDHVVVPPDWGTRLLGALREGYDVVGGPIENAARDRLLDWATFLCEYSACLPPLPAGPAEWLPGNNVVYRRSLLERYRAVTAEGGWENRLHDAIRADGIPLLCRPEIVVGHKKHFGFAEYLSQRFLYARSYAGARVARAGAGKRAAYGFAAFLLPPLLLYRTLQRLIAKRVAPGLMLKSLPLIGIFVLAWGWGEVVGSWFGAGGSLARVR